MKICYNFPTLPSPPVRMYCTVCTTSDRYRQIGRERSKDARSLASCVTLEVLGQTYFYNTTHHNTLAVSLSLVDRKRTVGRYDEGRRWSRRSLMEVWKLGSLVWDGVICRSMDEEQMEEQNRHGNPVGFLASWLVFGN